MYLISGVGGLGQQVSAYTNLAVKMEEELWCSPNIWKKRLPGSKKPPGGLIKPGEAVNTRESAGMAERVDRLRIHPERDS